MSRPTDEILTSQEIEAVQFAQNIYGARAKQAATELARILQLSDSDQKQLVGWVALRLEGLDFEGRREIATQCTALSKHVVDGSTPDEGVDHGEPALSLVPISTQEVHEASPSPTATNPEYVKEPAPALKKPVLRWLSEVFDEEDVAVIADMSPEERDRFLQILTETYKSFRIRSMGPKAKLERSEQLTAFMNGSTYSEIAPNYGVPPRGIASGMKSMAGSIKKRTTSEQRKELIASSVGSITAPGPQEHLADPVASNTALIPTASVLPEQATAAAAEFTEPQEERPEIHEDNTGINELQTRWLRKVITDVPTLSDLWGITSEQKYFLADRLGRRLNPEIIRSQGPIRTARRLEELKLLFMDLSYEEIAASTGVDIATVKQELHHSATRLRDKVSQRDLLAILKDSITYVAN
jgi:hypothetical protein